ncbi:basic proline-rich protein-like [Camelus ferus]|uniref:Basic proline-rich protein-like n=1 Tax=Camelus ferus TaxID=419612 RepID=A0A8B8SGT5_CAMFR|nr:basic proline-rich protein-like [Camelus ferus]
MKSKNSKEGCKQRKQQCKGPEVRELMLRRLWIAHLSPLPARRPWDVSGAVVASCSGPCPPAPARRPQRAREHPVWWGSRDSGRPSAQQLGGASPGGVKPGGCAGRWRGLSLPPTCNWACPPEPQARAPGEASRGPRVSARPGALLRRRGRPGQLACPSQGPDGSAPRPRPGASAGGPPEQGPGADREPYFPTASRPWLGSSEEGPRPRPRAPGPSGPQSCAPDTRPESFRRIPPRRRRGAPARPGPARPGSSARPPAWSEAAAHRPVAFPARPVRTRSVRPAVALTGRGGWSD